jgi:hypothetical protein
VADGKGMIFDNLEDTNEVIALDSRNGKNGVWAKTMGLDSKTHNLLIDTSDFEMPAATPQQPNPPPRAKPGTFRLLIYGR